MWGSAMSGLTSWPEVAERAAPCDRVAIAGLELCMRRGEATPHLEVTLRCGDAGTRVFALHAARPEPGVDAYTGVVEDLTARIAASARDDVLRAQLESARDADLGTWEVSLADETLHLSPDLERAFGRTIRSVREFLDYARTAVHVADQSSVRDAVASVMAGKAIGPLIFRVRDEHDAWRPLRHVGARVIRDGSGNPRTVVGAVQHFGWMHRRLERSERLLQRAVDSGGLGLWEWNPQTDEASFNAEWGEMLGYSFEELPSDTSLWRALLHPQDRAGVFNVLGSEDTEGAHRFRLSFRMRRRDRSLASIVCTALVTERDEAGRVTRVSGSNMDVSEIVEARLARERLEAQLARAQRMESLGQLAGGVAHDFNNALQVISASCELAEISPPHEVARCLVEVREAAMSAAVLTRQLLTFSRQQPAVETRVDLSERVAGLVPMLSRVLDSLYPLRVESHGLVTVSVDPSLLEQAVLNLVLNARDAMRGGGTIVVETGDATLALSDPRLPAGFSPGRYACLCVSDSGIGIAPEHLDEVFAPFFTTKEPGRGTGLGLAMVYGFAKQHRGFARVESSLGQGARFELWFPRVSDSVQPPRPDAAVARRGRGETLLIADDDTGVRRVLEKTLESAGYVVLAAADGPHAVELFRQHHGSIALVVLDMVMPNMSGTEAVSRMLEVAPPRGVLFVSGYLGGTLSHDFDATVPTRLLGKPWRREELLERVRSLLDDLERLERG